MAETLKDIRKASSLTLYQIISQLKTIEPTAPATHTGLIHLENRGTDRIRIIRALAQVYGLPLDRVERAASTPAKVCDILEKSI